MKKGKKQKKRKKEDQTKLKNSQRLQSILPEFERVEVKNRGIR